MNESDLKMEKRNPDPTNLLLLSNIALLLCN